MQNYLVWLFQQRGRGDAIGDLAIDAMSDLGWDGKMKSLKERIAEMSDSNAARDAYYNSVDEFRAQRKKY